MSRSHPGDKGAWKGGKGKEMMRKRSMTAVRRVTIKVTSIFLCCKISTTQLVLLNDGFHSIVSINVQLNYYNNNSVEHLLIL